MFRVGLYNPQQRQEKGNDHCPQNQDQYKNHQPEKSIQKPGSHGNIFFHFRYSFLQYTKNEGDPCRGPPDFDQIPISSHKVQAPRIGV